MPYQTLPDQTRPHTTKYDAQHLWRTQTFQFNLVRVLCYEKLSQSKEESRSNLNMSKRKTVSGQNCCFTSAQWTRALWFNRGMGPSDQSCIYAVFSSVCIGWLGRKIAWWSLYTLANTAENTPEMFHWSFGPIPLLNHSAGVEVGAQPKQLVEKHIL